MRRIINLLFFILLPGILIGENIIQCSQQSQINISRKIEVFKASKGFSDINDVLYLDHLFSPNNRRLLQINTDDNIVWTRVTLRNTNQYPLDLFLEFRNANIQEIRFFIKKAHLLIHKKQSGTRYPFYQRNIKNRFFVKQFTLEPNIKYTIFAKITNHKNKLKIPVNLYDQQGFNHRTSADNLEAGLFYGIFITLLLTSLLFLILKFHIKGQIFHMLYMLSFMALFFMLDGYALQYLFYDRPYITSYIIKIFPFLIILAVTELGRHYFKYYKMSSGFSFFLTAIGAMSFLAFVVSLAFQFSVHITMPFTLILAAMLLTGVFVHSRKTKITDKSHQYFFWAMIAGGIIIMLFGLEHYLNNYGYNDFHHIIKAVVIMQLSLISLSFYKRLQISHSRAHQNNIKNLEKLNRVTRQHNQELEKKVAERTQTLKAKNAELEEQIAENKAITEELHRQRDEMEALNAELEQSFKKSTADHVRLQKALFENQKQQEKLQQSFKEISEKNKKLETQNEEILSQRDKIREQHNLLEIKNRDITDSIIYAERIQNSILPHPAVFKEVFPESFVYFRPKEKLSGDFYWYDTIEQNGYTHHIVSAVDCTGHGIPGALMSIIAKDGLSEALNGKNLTDPGSILHHLNQVTIKTLNKKNNPDNLKDGMDLALVNIIPEKKQIYFAGARNPLYLLRNNEIYTYNGSIFSAGTLNKENIPINFETQKIDYQKGDMIYLFSDGLLDQFGGKKDNKFRYKRFNKMLKLIVNLPPEKQQKRIDEIFNNWKGNREQIDDILVIGIRL